MFVKLIIFLYLQISLIRAAPLLRLQPLPQQILHQQQQVSLQQQLLALQELQALQQLNVNPPMLMNQLPQPIAQPMLILLSNELLKVNKLNDRVDTNDNDDKQTDDYENENSDTVVIDAPNPHTVKDVPQSAILLTPDGGRFFIGGIISAIPFLPIEVNVPDTISWIYNGISSIISGIGQRLPFRPSQGNTPEDAKMLLKYLRQKPPASPVIPVFVLPMKSAMVPI